VPSKEYVHMGKDIIDVVMGATKALLAMRAR
jgi:hypothetical protein